MEKGNDARSCITYELPANTIIESIDNGLCSSEVIIEKFIDFSNQTINLLFVYRLQQLPCFLHLFDLEKGF